MEILRRLADSGKSVLVITHSVDLALKYADRLIAMSRGKVIADAHPLDVLSDAKIVGEAKLKRPLKAELCAIARRRGAA
jgi:ABC-type hemin transport system, ATPase component